MKFEKQNQKNVIAGVAKQSMVFASFVWVLSSFAFVACSDFGDRDNPLDPGAYNYEPIVDKPESSSSVIQSSSEESSASRSSSSSRVKNESSSSARISSAASSPSSSSQKETSSSSSSVPDSVPASSSSSSHKAFSSSSKAVQSSSSVIQSSSEASSASRSSSSSSQKNESSSSAHTSSAASPSSSSNNVSSSSKAPEPVEGSSSSTDSWTCGVSTLSRGDYEYKTVVIKEQCWTKENLRYIPSVGTTMCYGGENVNCEKYGRLYDYDAAALACPTGWRLPTSAEYEALAEYSMEGAPLYDAGAHFKASSGWTPENGDDFLEFTALPGGKCNEDQTCQNIGKMGYWWTSTEKVKNTSHLALALNGDGDSYSATNKMDNDQYISVRCVKK